jgi:hypothetical protein
MLLAYHAPFKRNDAMLAALPIGVMVFPGTGIQANLADKAKKLGIPVWAFGNETAAARAGGGAYRAGSTVPSGLISMRVRAPDYILASTTAGWRKRAAAIACWGSPAGSVAACSRAKC